MWVSLQVTEKHKYLANESTIVPFTILHCFVLWLLTDFASSNILNTSLVLSEWALMNKSTNTLTNRSIAKEKLHYQYAIQMTQFIMYKNCWFLGVGKATANWQYFLLFVSQQWEWTEKMVLGLALRKSQDSNGGKVNSLHKRASGGKRGNTKQISS